MTNLPSLKPVRLWWNNNLAFNIWVLEGTGLWGWNTAFVEGDVLDVLKEDTESWDYWGRALHDFDEADELGVERFVDEDVVTLSLGSGIWEEIPKVYPGLVNVEGVYELLLRFEDLDCKYENPDDDPLWSAEEFGDDYVI